MAITTPTRQPQSTTSPYSLRERHVLSRHYEKSQASGLSRLQAVLLLGMISVAATVLRLWNSAGQSLRLDEGFSLRWSSWPLFPHAHALTQRLLLTETAGSEHPPFYYLLLHFWIRAFGTNLATLRLPSEVAGILCVPALYLLASSFYGRGVALLAAFLGAVSPLWIWHAQEARMYPFLLLFTIVSTYGFVQAMEERRWWGWPILFVGSFMAIYTQYYAFMILFTQALFLVTHWRHYSWKRIFAWFASMAVLALTYVPWLLMLLRYYHGASDPSLQAPTLYTPLRILVGFLFGYLPETVTSQVLAAWPLLVLLCLALTVFGGAATRGGSLLWLLFLVPIIVAFIISLTVHPFISERYLIVSTPALYTMIAVIVTRLRGLLSRVLTFGAIVALLLVSWHAQEVSAANPNLEDYRTVASYMDVHARSGDVIALDSFYNQDAFSYYLHTNLPIYALPSLPSKSGGAPKATQGALERYLRGIEVGRTRLWVLYYLEKNYDPTNIVRHYLAYHTAHHTVIVGGPYDRNDAHYPASYANVQLIEYQIIPRMPATREIRPETIQEYRVLTHTGLSLREPFASSFGVSGTSASYNGEPIVMPQPGQAWRFGSVPASIDHSHITLFNSNLFKNDVWLRFKTRHGILQKHVFIPALSNMDIRLASWGMSYAHASVTICTTSSVVPSRTVPTGGHQERFEYAVSLPAAACRG